MRKLNYSIYLVITLLLLGCEKNAGIETENTILNSTPIRQLTPTTLIPSPIAYTERTNFVTPIAVATTTPTCPLPNPSEAQLNYQCLDVSPTLPPEVKSKGIVVLENRAKDKDGYLEPGTFLIDMSTGRVNLFTASNEGQSQHIVSPDKKMIAYISSVFESNCKKIGPNCKIIAQELVIASADGQQMKTMPIEEEWWDITAWLDNQHLVIQLAPQNNLERSGRKPCRKLVLNPFTGERQILVPNFPFFLDTPVTLLPWWDGWSGVIYDPQLKLAIYPRFLQNDKEKFTYAIWDLSQHKLVKSLDDIFSYYSILNDLFPMPLWSPDGKYFVMKGAILKQDHAEYELFRVSRDGQTEQLTHLNSVAYIQESYPWGSSISWSPDGRYLGLYLGKRSGFEEQARVALLDTLTNKVIDYCFPLTYGGKGYGSVIPDAPIWSPDGKQFLVVDWYEKDHQHVILVDIVQGVAAIIAEDMQPVGWMTAP
jgi:hypothetical protein